MSGKNHSKGPLDYEGAHRNHYYKGPLMYGNGCRFHHDCFTCPFSACWYDRPGVVGEYRRLQAQERVKARVRAAAEEQARCQPQAVQMARAGVSLAAISRALGISVYRVDRYIKEACGG